MTVLRRGGAVVKYEQVDWFGLVDRVFDNRIEVTVRYNTAWGSTDEVRFRVTEDELKDWPIGSDVTFALSKGLPG